MIVLQHTDCGITRLQDDDPLLASYLGVDAGNLPATSVGDPRAAVTRDVGVLADETRLGDGIKISGLVYDVGTGFVDTVVTP